jgi:hypothetical protein
MKNKILELIENRISDLLQIFHAMPLHSHPKQWFTDRLEELNSLKEKIEALDETNLENERK